MIATTPAIEQQAEAGGRSAGNPEDTQLRMSVGQTQ